MQCFSVLCSALHALDTPVAWTPTTTHVGASLLRMPEQSGMQGCAQVPQWSNAFGTALSCHHWLLPCARHAIAEHFRHVLHDVGHNRRSTSAERGPLLIRVMLAARPHFC